MIVDAQGRKVVIDVREITKMYKMGDIGFTRCAALTCKFSPVSRYGAFRVGQKR